MDIQASSSNEAKSILIKKYSIKPEYVLKVVDYRDIDRRDQEKFRGLEK